MSYIDIREPHTGKLLFRYDPERRIIEIQTRGVKTTIDLTRYDSQSAIGNMSMTAPVIVMRAGAITTAGL